MSFSASKLSCYINFHHLVHLRLGSRLQYPPRASQYVLSDYLSLGRRTRYYKETRADYYFLKHASSLWMGILGCAIQI